MKQKTLELLILVALFIVVLFLVLKRETENTIYYYSSYGNAKYYYPCEQNLKYEVSSKEKPKGLTFKNNCR